MIAAAGDKIVTTFCKLVMPRCEVMNARRARRGTKVVGEAMASTPRGRNGLLGVDAPPVFCAALACLALLATGCDDDAPPRAVTRPTAPSAERAAVADPALGMTTVLDGATPAFAAAVLAEATGDDAAARQAFERVLGAADASPAVAARAALHLAWIEARAGERRRALDDVVRAAALAPTDLAIAEGVAQLQSEDAQARELRGPRLGTPLPGVEPRIAERFAAAERALAAVHALHPRPFIESLSSSIRLKEDATVDVVARYRAIAEAGGLAAIASDYRAGSLYHDLALGLLFELPPELDPSVAAGLRRSLRGAAVGYLHKAVAAYRECLARPPLPDAELWRVAAETDVRAAEALLAAAGEGSAAR